MDEGQVRLIQSTGFVSKVGAAKQASKFARNLTPGDQTWNNQPT